jgi:hypothetical protein
MRLDGVRHGAGRCNGRGLASYGWQRRTRAPCARQPRGGGNRTAAAQCARRGRSRGAWRGRRFARGPCRARAPLLHAAVHAARASAPTVRGRGRRRGRGAGRSVPRRSVPSIRARLSLRGRRDRGPCSRGGSGSAKTTRRGHCCSALAGGPAGALGCARSRSAGLCCPHRAAGRALYRRRKGSDATPVRTGQR